MIRKLLCFFPLLKFQVYENSMKPALLPGDTIFVSNLPYLFYNPHIDDIVVVKRHITASANQYFIKRIKKIARKSYFVVGDNQQESIDSRQFGWIAKKDIVGKVVYTL